MTRNLEKLVTFASPTIMRLNMETITLSYEPGSDFAKALDELIRNSEGVRVVRCGKGNESKPEQLLERFVKSRPQVPALSEKEIMEEVKAIRYGNESNL